MTNGRPIAPNDATPYITEYASRMRLKELGFSDPLAELDDYKGKVFVEISTQLSLARERKRKK